MSVIYIVYHNKEDQDNYLLVEDEETAKLYVKLGPYDYYDGINYDGIILADAEDLADDIFEYYTYLRDCGVENMGLSDEELKKKITEDSDGAIIYD